MKSKISKDTLNKEIQRIYDRDGKVEAKTVVDESRSKDAPLHDLVEWRNQVAGDLYRLEQSRRYIRKARILENGQPTQLVHVPRAAIKVNIDVDDSPEGIRAGYYKTASVIVQDIDEYTRAYEVAQKALMSAKNRVIQLEEAARAGSRDETELARIAAALKALSTAEQALMH